MAKLLVIASLVLISNLMVVSTVFGKLQSVKPLISLSHPVPPFDDD
ncbi:hypothetical protein H0X06_05455 [Candidatus Dependentiae bacterium]|nr:hypothetical protein [Candidatus Dependentiae bacterium]